MNCAICGAVSTPVFTKTVLVEHEVNYFRCGECGYLHTETPYWLDQAYSSAIASLDIGLVQRNITFAERIEEIILSSFDPQGRFLDYAGGYGLLVRLMRDRGFDYYWTDRYCSNLFARYFSLDDLQRRGSDFELVTAIEVLEHLVDPYKELDEMLGYSKSLLFTTELIPEGDIDDWWYLSPETGQHVGFFSLDALHVIADRYGLNLVSDGCILHLLTDLPIQRLPEDRSRQPRWRRILRSLSHADRPKSRLIEDFEIAKGVVSGERRS